MDTITNALYSNFPSSISFFSHTLSGDCWKCVHMSAKAKRCQSYFALLLILSVDYSAPFYYCHDHHPPLLPLLSFSVASITLLSASLQSRPYNNSPSIPAMTVRYPILAIY